MKEGASQKYGARILRDVVAKYVESQIAFAFASEELIAGDKILFDLKDGRPVIRRQRRPKNQITDVEIFDISNTPKSSS